MILTASPQASPSGPYRRVALDAAFLEHVREEVSTALDSGSGHQGRRRGAELSGRSLEGQSGSRQGRRLRVREAGQLWRRADGPRDSSGDQAMIAPRLGPSLIEQAPRSASTNRLSGINASASLHRTGPAPHGRGVARLLSDCHAAAVEAREGEAVEGFAEGSALVPQHADSHFLAERH